MIHYPLGYDVKAERVVNHHYLNPLHKNKWSRLGFESNFILYTGRLSEVTSTLRDRTEENFLRVRESLLRVPFLAWSFSLAMTSSSSRNLRCEGIQITTTSNVGGWSHLRVPVLAWSFSLFLATPHCASTLTHGVWKDSNPQPTVLIKGVQLVSPRVRILLLFYIQAG